MLCWIICCQFSPSPYSPICQRAWMPGNYIYRTSASKEPGWIPAMKGTCVRRRRQERSHIIVLPPAIERFPSRIGQQFSTCGSGTPRSPWDPLREYTGQNYFHNHTKTLFAFLHFHPLPTVQWNWDRLEPGILCCSACTWTNISSSKKIQRNCKGLKITVCIHSWGKLWTRRYKKTKTPTAISEELGAKAGYWACPLHSTPPRGWADHLSHASGPTPGHTPALTPYKEAAHPPWEGNLEQGNLLLVLAPPCCSRSPRKALPEFLVWPLINFCWLGKAKNPGR